MTLFMVLLAIFLIYILFSIMLAISKTIKLKWNFWTVKRIGIIVIGYSGLGIIALIYLALTSNGNYDTLSGEEIEQIMIDENKFSELWNEKQGDKFAERYLVDEWSMRLSSDEVTFLRESEDTYGRIYVLIDWRDDADSNEIYAKTYQIPFVFKGIDLSKEITKNQFEFTDDTLIVKKPVVQQFTFNSINPKIELVEWNMQAVYSQDQIVKNAVTGSTYLYLNVPNHVTIIDEGKLRFYP